MNFNLSNIVLYEVLCGTLVIANPDILPVNGASTFISYCSFGFITIHSFGKTGKDLCRKLKQQSCEFMAPSNSNIFLILETMSTFLCISDTKVYISNLCPCMSTIIGILNKTLTNCLFPSWNLCVLDATFGRE